MCENRLEELKDKLELKSKDVAKYLNVAESTYSEWEHNKIPIPTRRIIQLADFYKINIDYILNLSNKKITINTNTEINLNNIGKNIKEIRKKLNLSLREMGKKINCSFSSFASYERGEKLITSDILISLCSISGYSIDWVLCRTKNKLNKKSDILL